eukprot:TRINITY_DN1267_c0_g3_i2.p1 TRINITY_DN1267_c0_g3~~TRINITY_DN1267_c0_g3_i2.p1  ORF type:complete len:855 (-),score=181.86 TRINITY_DN1267_c0_g3_i2:72-2636(-)
MENLWELEDPNDIAECLAGMLEQLAVMVGGTTPDIKKSKSQLMRQLNKFVATSDWVLAQRGYRALGRVLAITRLEHQVNSQDDVYMLSLSIMNHASFDPVIARTGVTLQLSAQLFESLQAPGGIATLARVCHRIYDVFKPYRPQLRKEIISSFRAVALGSGGTSTFGSHTVNQSAMLHLGAVPVLLQIVHSIIRGIHRLPISRSFNAILNAMLELHAPNKMLNDTEAVLSLYHKELMACEVALVKVDPRASEGVLMSILKHWPKANSTKEALLLSELESIMELTPSDILKKHLVPLWTQIATCMASQNFRASERALMMWSGDYFLSFCLEHLQDITPLVLHALLREGNKHWNPTVNSMTYNVLEFFYSNPQAKQHMDQESVRYWRSLDQYKGLSKQDCLRFTDEYVSKLKKDRDAIAAKKERNGAQRGIDDKLFSEKLRHSDFVFSHGELGDGSYSTVRFCKLRNLDYDQSEWQEFAIKSVDKEFIAQQNYVDNIEREITMMRSFDHPNILKLFTVFEDQKHIHIVLDYCKGGDLHSCIKRLGSFDLAWARFVTAEIVAALEYLHQQGIVYNDLKPENVLLTEDNHVKLADFGSAHHVDQYQPKYGADGELVMEGTADYLSPEEVRGEAPGMASDLWSLGCVIYQLFAGRTPYWAETQDEILTAIVQFEREYPASMPEVARDLVERLLVPEPQERLGAMSEAGGGYEALKRHEFFQGIDFSTLQKTAAPAPAGGSIGPAVNAKWTQRTYSMLSAPLPQKYARDASSEYPVIDEESEGETVWPNESTPPTLDDTQGTSGASGRKTGPLPSVAEGGPPRPGAQTGPRQPPRAVAGVRMDFEPGQYSVFNKDEKPPQ